MRTKKEFNERIGVRLTPEQRDFLENIAKAENTKISVIIREAINDYIINYENEEWYKNG